ncbi:MAG: ADP-ribosylglycohydrolase family protein [Anaerolineae bacterium]|nr:ADP-ribosylglycohydrolase family protein [Anaerolineae bacterium]
MTPYPGPAQSADVPRPLAESRYLGCLLGLACGDAVGTTLEFQPRGAFAPIDDLVGGGPFQLRAGEWTDDTSMALCLAVSLLERQGFDARDQLERYCRWREAGYLSSNGRCFDIGNTVRAALDRYRRTGDPFSGSTAPNTAGNGSIMRLAPIPMYYADDLALVAHYAAESSRATHGAREAVDACRLFGVMLALALRGASKDEALFTGHRAAVPPDSLTPKIAAIAAGDYRTKSERDIRGSGYVVASLEAALWCFYHTGAYRDAVLCAANLGDDADTTAAICGQLAGATYGIAGIPRAWRAKLALRDFIETTAKDLYRHRHAA